MKSYDEIALKELIKHKKRTVFTLLGIILGLVMLIFLGEVNNLNKQYELQANKYATGDKHSKFLNINGEQASKLLNNSLIEKVGFTYTHREVTRYEHSEGYSEITEEIFYADKSYLEKILMNDSYEIEGRIPLSEDEIIIGNKETINKKIGDKINVLGKDRVVVGFITNVLDIGASDRKILGIKDVSQMKSVNAHIKLINEKNIVKSIKEIGKDIGVTEFLNWNEVSEVPRDKPLIDLNIDRILLLGEKITLGRDIYYPDKSTAILQGILILALIFFTYISINASVKEKKKAYFMLKCIGASNGQIRRLILKESLIVSVISIIPGIILGEIIFLGIRERLLGIINEYGIDIRSTINFKIILIAVIISLIVCIISSLIPMIWLSKLSPIEGIKDGNLKGRKKKIKSSFIRKIFGYEGELAYKNLKSDKVNLIGLTLAMVISLTIFNVFTSYYTFKLKEIKRILGATARDFQTINYLNDDKIYNELENILSKYKEIGSYAKKITYTPFIRIEGLDKDILKDSQNYAYFDKNKEVVMPRNWGYTYVINDKYFNDLLPYIDGNNINLEEFKNNGAILFSNEEKGAIYSPKNRNNIRVYMDDEIEKTESFKTELGEVHKPIISKGAKTDVLNLNLMGTVYLETVFGELEKSDGNFIGIIISESTAKNLKSKFDEQYIFEFKNESLRAEYMPKIEKDLKELFKDDYENIIYDTAKAVERETVRIHSIALIIYLILMMIVAMAIISLINIRDIILNNRKKEFGIMFAVGMDKVMLRKSLIYEGLIQCLIALIIGNGITLVIFEVIQNFEKKFSFSYGVMILGTLIIIIVSILNTLNSIRRLNLDKPIEMIRSID
ncbi:ABC transporter permease [Clostridium thermobutyricum]|uniref:FtsX-like permease family protein n=1 Tax=Clostridium thermobutyricum DSM 4928 TaxID=1121339 RepID=A0A1V4SUQ0_9CLOT|nr:FtsX-like permease family protein [Clostridium thermobutyricum]OPX47021.1 FtsX-like permease family protein [Clostridium thermobutyricum DSM 4928]